MHVKDNQSTSSPCLDLYLACLRFQFLLLSKVITDSEELFSRLKDQNSQRSLAPPYYNVPSVNFKKVRCTRTCICMQENNIVYMYIYFELGS